MKSTISPTMSGNSSPYLTGCDILRDYAYAWMSGSCSPPQNQAPAPICQLGKILQVNQLKTVQNTKLWDKLSNSSTNEALMNSYKDLIAESADQIDSSYTNIVLSPTTDISWADFQYCQTVTPNASNFAKTMLGNSFDRHALSTFGYQTNSVFGGKDTGKHIYNWLPITADWLATPFIQVMFIIIMICVVVISGIWYMWFKKVDDDLAKKGAIVI